jgi:Predicted membrane protein
MTPKNRFLSALALSVALAVPSVWAQETNSVSSSNTGTEAAQLQGLWLTTAFPELAVKPGETASISLSLRNEQLPPQRVSLDILGVPDGWTSVLKGGGREVSAAIVSPNASQSLTLELTPPADASAGSEHTLEVVADTGSQKYTLPLSVTLSETEVTTAGISLETELPALRGTPRTTFSFKVKVSNDGPEDGLFNFAAQVPAGFQSRFKRGYGSEEITGLPIAAGATETVTLEVIPSRTVSVGQYKVGFTANGEGQSASTELDVEIAGEPAITIVGPQERLSGEAVAGQETSFPFTLVNAGAAPAEDIEMSASAPTGWTVTFDPETVSSIAPNALSEVNVKIKPSEQAVAGDYVVTVKASGGTVAESAQFRVTVKTSSLWGAVGLGVIAVAVLVLVVAIMRYGRR